MTPLRVAAFQRFPKFDDVAGTGEALLEDLRWANERSVDLALFPECYLQGYDLYDPTTFARRSLSLDDRALLDVLARFGPQIRTTAVIGLIERRAATIYNSAIVVADGKVMGRYAKAHPNEKGISAGLDFPIFTVSEWPFGINICNDANYPAAAEQVAKQGARLLCYPLNNMLKPSVAAEWRSRSVGNLRARAIQTRCWVMSADVAGNHSDLMSYGCTLIVRPDGQVVARANELEEGVALFDLT